MTKQKCIRNLDKFISDSEFHKSNYQLFLDHTLDQTQKMVARYRSESGTETNIPNMPMSLDHEHFRSDIRSWYDVYIEISRVIMSCQNKRPLSKLISFDEFLKLVVEQDYTQQDPYSKFYIPKPNKYSTFEVYLGEYCDSYYLEVAPKHKYEFGVDSKSKSVIRRRGPKRGKERTVRYTEPYIIECRLLTYYVDLTSTTSLLSNYIRIGSQNQKSSYSRMLGKDIKLSIYGKDIGTEEEHFILKIEKLNMKRDETLAQFQWWYQKYSKVIDYTIRERTECVFPYEKCKVYYYFGNLTKLQMLALYDHFLLFYAVK